ncbi:MAG: redoxin domain-containing protein [Deltaproteobacteria bacterium]|nr:redoxin domain-containing protein [Deltaproteobacteria bacterium]
MKGKTFFLLMAFVLLGSVFSMDALAQEGKKEAEKKGEAKVEKSEEAEAAGPAWTLKSLDGKLTVTSEDFLKPAVFVLMQTACNRCREEVKDFHYFAGADEYKAITFYLVNVDVKPEKVLPQYLDFYKITNFKVLVDPEFQFGPHYNVTFTPAAILIGKDGKQVDILKGYKEGTAGEIKGLLDKLL